MASRKRPDRSLSALDVAKLLDERFPTVERQPGEWRPLDDADRELNRQRRELAASCGYSLLDLFRARVQARFDRLPD